VEQTTILNLKVLAKSTMVLALAAQLPVKLHSHALSNPEAKLITFSKLEIENNQQEPDETNNFRLNF
jgi:hypothetical protein